MYGNVAYVLRLVRSSCVFLLYQKHRSLLNLAVETVSLA